MLENSQEHLCHVQLVLPNAAKVRPPFHLADGSNPSSRVSPVFIGPASHRSSKAVFCTTLTHQPTAIATSRYFPHSHHPIESSNKETVEHIRTSSHTSSLNLPLSPPAISTCFLKNVTPLGARHRMATQQAFSLLPHRPELYNGATTIIDTPSSFAVPILRQPPRYNRPSSEGLKGLRET
ncbi:hypothetical protein H0H87_004716 [Tephrocybe sp. NHM501043]|nr:hypothetical protein H0H87_004716 [Tephrocybe sp. NHM501043]